MDIYDSTNTSVVIKVTKNDYFNAFCLATRSRGIRLLLKTLYIKHLATMAP